MGKSRTVTIDIMKKIVDRLAHGETLVDITNDDSMPTYRAVTRAVAGDDNMYELYRRGRIAQCEWFTDRINKLAMEPLPEGLDVRELNAEVNRRRLEIDTLKWTTARNQPFGIRDKKEDQPQSQAFTISWQGGDVAVNALEDEEQDAMVKH
jgi:hypothetical protein|tara:strand:+ start:289 stop:741 length:453 start_codon:yes stop_codon:yes gene_type:complete